MADEQVKAMTADIETPVFEHPAFDAMVQSPDGVVITRHQHGDAWDLLRLGMTSGSRVRITTPAGTAVAVAEVTDTMMDGHIALPNGLGLAYSPAGGEPELTGVAPNELTLTDWCNPIAKTPWHKHVPAHLEAVNR